MLGCVVKVLVLTSVLSNVKVSCMHLQNEAFNGENAPWHPWMVALANCSGQCRTQPNLHGPLRLDFHYQQATTNLFRAGLVRVICGGTLVLSDWVVSAAHCTKLYSFQAPDIWVNI